MIILYLLNVRLFDNHNSGQIIKIYADDNILNIVSLLSIAFIQISLKGTIGYY